MICKQSQPAAPEQFVGLGLKMNEINDILV